MLSPALLRLFRGVNIAIFALPPIAISPVLVLTLSGMAPRVILAALGCYFATMTATVLGLTQADQRSLDVVRAYGGRRFDEMRFVQLRSALPTILGGFRVAAPAAVLGAILAEFGGGGRFGLGTTLALWALGVPAPALAVDPAEAERLLQGGLVVQLRHRTALLVQHQPHSGAVRVVRLQPGAPGGGIFHQQFL